jgi:hypothetical protein
MNERIQALMDQAVSFRLDPDSNAYEALVSPEDLTVFAELIVRECAEFCERTDSYLFAKMLKEHFGVES